MAVYKALARLLRGDGVLIGEGRAYVHLRQAQSLAQRAQGTLALEWWSDEDAPSGGLQLELREGPRLTLEVQSDKLSACIAGRVLRYSADWPGQV